MVREAVAEVPLREAVTVADWLAVTEPAEAVKEAEEDAAATVTEAGTVSVALLEERATLAPPVGAAWERVPVQAEFPPDATVVGLHCKLETVTAGGVMVREAVAEVPLREAVTVADWLEETEPAEAVTDAPEAAPARSTEAGTVSVVLLEERATLAPPVGAAWE